VSRSKLFTFLDWKPLTFLGALSYSLYLWQQVFTMLAHRGGVFVWIGGFGLVAAAVGSYYILEKPLVERFRDKKPARLNSKPVEVVAE
jgi:peptidoglycan/LPS O-acetylase OafA/YrhL